MTNKKIYAIVFSILGFGLVISILIPFVLTKKDLGKDASNNTESDFFNHSATTEETLTEEASVEVRYLPERVYITEYKSIYTEENPPDQAVCNSFYKSQIGDKPEASDEEITKVLTKARNYYRDLRFYDGYLLLQDFADHHTIPNSLIGKEFALLFWESIDLSNLDKCKEYGEDGAYRELASRSQDPETFLLSMIGIGRYYDYVLNKKSTYIEGYMGLITQGERLSEDSEYYDYARQEVAADGVTDVYKFPIIYNKDYVYNYFVTRVNGKLYLLMLESQTGSLESPYSLNNPSKLVIPVPEYILVEEPTEEESTEENSVEEEPTEEKSVEEESTEEKSVEKESVEE